MHHLGIHIKIQLLLQIKAFTVQSQKQKSEPFVIIWISAMITNKIWSDCYLSHNYRQNTNHYCQKMFQLGSIHTRFSVDHAILSCTESVCAAIEKTESKEDYVSVLSPMDSQWLRHGMCRGTTRSFILRYP